MGKLSLWLKSESIWHPCSHLATGSGTSEYRRITCNVFKVQISEAQPSKVLMWGLCCRSKKYSLVARCPGDLTGGPQTTCLHQAFRWLIPLPVVSHLSQVLWQEERTALLPGGSGNCPEPSSPGFLFFFFVLQQFLNPWNTKLIWSPFEPLALMLRVLVY